MGDPGLGRILEHVLFAPHDKMELVSHPPQEVPALSQDGRILLVQILAPGCRQIADPGATLERPLQQVDVAQAPRTLFDVGLKKLYRAALRVALLAQALQVGDRFLGQLLEQLLTELLEQTLVAGEEAGVQHGRAGFDVMPRYLHGLRDRAAAVPDLELQIPQRMQHAGDESGRLVTLLREQKQQIDVRMG